METYTDSNGKTWVKIINYWSLHSKMLLKYGKNWREECISSYGHEQLYVNEYDEKGRKC